jgi:pyruvate,water dikinase
VLGFDEVDQTMATVVGGKGAHLGELSGLDGVGVPPGFCVTTRAFEQVIARAPALVERLASMSTHDAQDREVIRAFSADIRQAIEGIAVPDDVAGPIAAAVAALGDRAAYAVRSSATGEDSATASFAGQHDSYLNVAPSAVFDHVKRCWGSLFTERAVTYRLRNGADHRSAHMAVVVQHMVNADAAGTMFTTDPVTSNRRVVSIEAAFGLGEAVVAGIVNTDRYTVRDGQIVDRTIASKDLAAVASPHGGTHQHPIDPDRRTQPALTDLQVLRLAELGRRIEAHFGCPQDIEWCLVGDDFEVVQTRPITTLFPVPALDDDANHVYLSVGHQQMMTDAMKPLGLSFWQLTTPAPMSVAAGRLFVDVTPALSSHAGRAGLLETAGRSDPLTRDALETVVERHDFLPPPADQPPAGPAGPPAGNPPEPIDADPGIVAELIADNQAAIDTLQREIAALSGPAVFEFILADMDKLKQTLFAPRSHQVVMAAMEATWWLNDHLHEWLDEKGAADTLAQSAPNSVTADMGLALLDVADAIRPHPEVVAFLETVDGDDFVDELPRLAGGERARAAIAGFLEAYGMRCVGEIDITRPRWTEHPATLVPLILANVANFDHGAAKRRFEHGQHEAARHERQLLKRIRTLPDGDARAAATKEMIDRLRTFIGYREYPKYGMVSRYFIYKQALLREAERLAANGVIADPHDICYLTFHELRDAVRNNNVERDLIEQRRQEHTINEALTPPRVLTSDGETIAGAYHRRDAPAGALIGLPVSAGVIEGRARIAVDLAGADLEPGDILVTTHTDPSWSPLFVTIAGLVTEVGGLMTHGAVVAREYGLPAVVGVEQATNLIADGQHIRIDGTHGHIELLP